jgi:hypothetical protein
VLAVCDALTFYYGIFIIPSSRNVWVIKVNRIALLSRMDKLRQEIGPVGITTAELVEEGRRR